MKKLLFLLLLPVMAFAQVSTGKEQKFLNGIRNLAPQTVTDPVYLVSQGIDGTEGKVSPHNLPVPTSVIDSLELKTTNSSGAVSGFAVTNNGNGTVNIAEGIAYLKSTNDPYAPIVKYTIPAVTNLSLTDNANNYILVDYNGGTPAITVTTNPATINTQTNSLAIVVARVGTTLDYLSLVGQNVDANAKLRIRFLNQEGIRRASGATLGFSSRNLTLTPGVLFSGLIRVNTLAFNTASPDTFTLAYNNGSVWTRTTGQTQVNNTQYNVSGVLTTMPNNTFRTDYVYLLPNNPSKLYVIMGTATYGSLTLAKASPRPSSLPVELQALGLEVGRLFIEKNSAVIAEVQSSFSNEFVGASVPEHNSLTGLQGGTAGEFNHLTNAQVALVNGSEQTANKQNNLTPDPTGVKYPTVDGVIYGKVFNDIASTSVLGNLQVKGVNPGLIYIGDSNLEGYFTAGVGDDNWANKVSKAIQKYQGANSDIAVCNFNSPSRYGLTYGGTTAIVAKGGVNQALEMQAGSTITFTASANYVEVYFNRTVGSGVSLEFRRNGILYRTVSINGTALDNVSSFLISPTTTPSDASATYEIKAVGGTVTVTALFKSIYSAKSEDTYYFMRQAVAAKSFADFNVPALRDMSGLTDRSGALFLLALGTNSIYGATTATSSAQFKIDLVNYITGLRSAKTDVVYIVPPRALETMYPPVLEPYANYYAKIQEVIKEYNLAYIDLNETVMYFESDGLHYSIAGHQAIASYVINQLPKLNPVKVGLDEILYNGNTSAKDVNIGALRASKAVKANGRIYSVSDDNFDDLATTTGSVEMGYSQSGQTGVIQSYNYTTSTFKPLEFNSGSIKFKYLEGSGDRVLLTNSAGYVSAVIGLSSGSYTPTLTNDTNITSSSATNATHTKVGNIVNVSVGVNITPTAVSTNTILKIPLPVNRATTGTINIGNCNLRASTEGISGIVISTSTSEVTVLFTSSSASALHSGTVNFQYSILD